MNYAIQCLISSIANETKIINITLIDTLSECFENECI